MASAEPPQPAGELGSDGLFFEDAWVGRVACHLEPSLSAAAPQLLLKVQRAWTLVGNGARSATEIFDLLSERLASASLIPPLTGERCFVTDLGTGAAVATVDRSATIFLGIRTEGVHLNAYRQTTAGSWGLWLARRSARARSFPGRLDNLVAGCVPAFRSSLEALIREGWEEAGLRAELVRAATPSSPLFYRRNTPLGVVDVRMTIYDLEVPEEFQPRNHDGSLEGFLLVSGTEAGNLARQGEAFKPNSAEVVLDFLARRSVSWDSSASLLPAVNVPRSRTRS